MASEGELVVTAEPDTRSEMTKIYEVTFSENCPALLTFKHAPSEMVADFGTDQHVPYCPAEFAESRFTGRICGQRETAQTWLEHAAFGGKFDGLGLRFGYRSRFTV